MEQQPNQSESNKQNPSLVLPNNIQIVRKPDEDILSKLCHECYSDYIKDPKSLSKYHGGGEFLKYTWRLRKNILKKFPGSPSKIISKIVSIVWARIFTTKLLIREGDARLCIQCGQMKRVIAPVTEVGEGDYKLGIKRYFSIKEKNYQDFNEGSTERLEWQLIHLPKNVDQKISKRLKPKKCDKTKNKTGGALSNIQNTTRILEVNKFKLDSNLSEIKENKKHNDHLISKKMMTCSVANKINTTLSIGKSNQYFENKSNENQYYNNENINLFNEKTYEKPNLFNYNNGMSYNDFGYFNNPNSVVQFRSLDQLGSVSTNSAAAYQYTYTQNRGPKDYNQQSALERDSMNHIFNHKNR